MTVFFKPTFIRDFADLPERVKSEVRLLCTETFADISSLRELTGYNIKPITNFKNFYRIRIGEYRIGFKKEGEKIVFMRVKNRKDFYRFFQ